MNIQHIVVLWMILTSESRDPSVSAYFRIRRGQEFQTVNSCLPVLGSFPVASFQQCQIACLENQQCRTATFHSNSQQCDLFSTPLDDGRLTPIHSAIVFSLIERSSTTDATNKPILTQITSPNNEIVGVWNTNVGQDSTPIQENGYSEGCSPPDQDVRKIIDNDISSKHVSFGPSWNTHQSELAGHNTGFYIKPSRPSVLTHICWGTSSEQNETARDPLIISIEGSNETSSMNLVHGSSWSLIYNGTSGLENFTLRSSYKLIPLHPSKSSAFRSYRLLVSKKRGVEDSVQYSEMQLFGYFTDEQKHSNIAD